MSADVYPDPQTCPECGASLKGPKHPESAQEYYGHNTHGNLAIGVSVKGVYDGVLYWICPLCSHAFPRDFGAAVTLQRTSEERAEHYNARKANVSHI